MTGNVARKSAYNWTGPSRAVDVDAIKAAHPEGRAYPIGVDTGSMIGGIRNLLTFEGLAYACYDYPDMVVRHEVVIQVIVHPAQDQGTG